MLGIYSSNHFSDSVKKLCADEGTLLSDITSRRSSSMSSLPSSSNTDGVLLQFLGNKKDCDTSRTEAVPLKVSVCMIPGRTLRK